MEEQADANTQTHKQSQTCHVVCFVVCIFGLMVAHGKEAHHNRACSEAHGSKAPRRWNDCGPGGSGPPHDNPGPEHPMLPLIRKESCKLSWKTTMASPRCPAPRNPRGAQPPRKGQRKPSTTQDAIVPTPEGHNRQEGWRNTISRMLNRNGRPTPEGRQRTAAPRTQGPKSVRHSSRWSTYDPAQPPT